jgi:hypothetical protein
VRQCWFRAGFLALSVLSAPAAVAGEVTACLSNSLIGCDGRELQNVPFKSVVLEFLDPRASGQGESVSRLLWRDVLFAIRDMRGRGVILGKDFEGAVRSWYGSSPDDLLDQHFHDAAIEIGRFLQTQMIVWGAIVPGDSSMTLYSFLTILPDHWSRSPGLVLVPTDIIAKPSQSSFNFAPMVTSAGALFAGRVGVRCAKSAGCPKGIEAYQQPADNLRVAHYFKVGEQIDVLDMRGKWMTIAAPGGGILYMNIYQADLGPRAVLAQKLRNVGLQSAPGSRQSIASVDLDGRYEVVEMGRGARDVPWYKIATPDAVGWIDGSLVDPLYRFPLTHFLAGLYRYEAGDLVRSEKEFRHYVETVGEEGDRITRSLALQLIAAARAQSKRGTVNDNLDVLTLLDAAAKLTPFDPAIYRMRALVLMVNQHRWDGALRDLRHAVEVGREDKNTDEFLLSLEYIPHNLLASLGISEYDYRKQVRELRASLEVP